ncbi:heavy-metal-associated domain-containing protein [Arthrobacter sp. LAPM80]|uniref:heavy-metal-associated domain-containing protein n=1 Tax=Arthrobacter sp. LAPM80 TaxID=3141788 RepID=UPI00398B217E
MLLHGLDTHDSAPSDLPGTAGTRYDLEGLTCGHCVKTVETAVSAAAGVASASVDLVTGGISTLTITGDPKQTSVLTAVKNAGYTLVGI